MTQSDRNTYSTSKHGRFGYMIHMIVVTIFSPIFPFLSLDIWSKGEYLPSVAFMFLGFLFVKFSIYSTIHLFKKSPRFILDDDGITCLEFFGKTKISWNQLESYRINYHAGAMVFIDLYLKNNLENKRFFKKHKRLDVSGLTPNYKELCEDISTYLHRHRRSE